LGCGGSSFHDLLGVVNEPGALSERIVMQNLDSAPGDGQMVTVRVPKALQDLFGEEIARLELWLTLLFGVVVCALLVPTTYEEWSGLSPWRQIALLLLAFDIGGGVVGNFSYSTNRYYRRNARARLTFILYHVQPVALAFLLGGSYPVAIGVTAYAIAAAIVTNALIDHPAQRIIGASFMLAGVMVLLLTVHGVPAVLLALYALYMFKVIYGFAVDHYAQRETWRRSAVGSEREVSMRRPTVPNHVARRSHVSE
jgi:hypothetical protein